MRCGVWGLTQVPLPTHKRLVAIVAEDLLEGGHAAIKIALVSWLPLVVGAETLSQGAKTSDMMVGSCTKSA